MGKIKTNWDYLVDLQGNYVGSAGGGQKGDRGFTGAPGTNGINGVDGADGAKGEEGPIATGAFIFKGNVANAAALPTTGNTVGDSYVQQDTNELVVWDGTAFTGQGTANTTTVKGEPGEDFKYSDFTPVQLAALKGEPFVYTDFTTAQLDALKGEPGTLPLISTLPVLP